MVGFRFRKVLVISILTFLTISIFAYFSYRDYKIHHIETVWGECLECDDELLEIINSPVIQRLKHIDQSGSARYLGPKLPAFTRFDHSIGVALLIKKAGGSLKELVAGLFHDASHTVFSHVGDYIWSENINEYAESSYQDSIHLNYLKKNKVSELLKDVDLELEDLDVDKNEYYALEQSLPDMCADRIEYNIHTGIITGKLSKDEANEILQNLQFKDKKWFFTSVEAAKKFADLSLYFTQNFWGSKWNTSMNIHFANLLKRALKLKLITTKDLFTKDKLVMIKLIKNQDSVIQLNLQQCKFPLVMMPGKEYKKEMFYPKFRGVDPLVMNDSGEMQRLSELDMMFKNHYDEVKKWCKNGFEIDILADVNSKEGQS